MLISILVLNLATAQISPAILCAPMKPEAVIMDLKPTCEEQGGKWQLDESKDSALCSFKDEVYNVKVYKSAEDCAKDL